ncbi:MAG TPA: hypothetical protein VK272_13390 [Solirubrobacteraceae bacterium]|nr:hypothetical protein [Solirubrobacteraceae bacterium]
MSAPDAMYELDGLYNLLPAIYRTRDATLGSPLRTLLRAIGTQVDQLTADIDQLYQNWFIETCEDDLVPYFAQLVGLDLGPVPASGGDFAAAGTNATWRRREVADAIADRRRKGSFSVLEQLAFDATGWPARALELTNTTLATQSIRFPTIGHRRSIDMRDGDALDVLDTPLSRAAPLADVRRLSSHRTPGGTVPGGVAVWLWRLVADGVQRAPARVHSGDSRYCFDPLGRDTALAVSPAPRAPGAAPVLDLDVPVPISRGALARRTADYYGPGRSICVYRAGEPVPREEIVVADLAGWRHRVPPGRVAIDPERGRIAFPSRHPPQEGIEVSYSRLTVGGIGGGSYERPLSPTPANATVYAVGTSAGQHRSIRAALDAWTAAKRKGTASPAAVIEIGHDGVYAEPLQIELSPGEQLVLQAAQGCRPVLIPLEDRGDRPDRLLVRGREHEPPEQRRGRGAKAKPPPVRASAPPAELPSLTLDGIWIAGHPLELDGLLGHVSIRHCTLVPAVGDEQLQARHDLAPSLVVRALPCPISISSSVLGRIEVDPPELGFDPVALSVADSVLAASRLRGRALTGVDGERAFASLTLERATVLGSTDVHDVRLIESSILNGPLRCERRQTGSVRFSYIAPESETPRRTGCQPDKVREAVEEEVRRGTIEASERARALARETARVEPRFDSVVFGERAYARLATGAATELIHGAADEGELGVYHDMWQALAVADLRRRLREFAPAGTDIGIRFAT